MNNQVKAILFDMGGTLRRTVKRTPEEKQQIIQRMLNLLGSNKPVKEFTSLLSQRAKAYKAWAEGTHIELNESDLWTKWMLPDFPAEQISGMAIQLNQLYRESTGARTVLPESQEVILELFRRGYRLGLVSNTTSSVEVPDLLKELQVTGCFETVILSAVVGTRKPNPAILLEATQRMGIAPEHCAYIGDRVDRDVAASRQAGFSKALILRDPNNAAPVRMEDTHLAPDHEIDNLRELLDIFPPFASHHPKPDTAYDVSLSTMWGIKTFPRLTDFFEFARREGFARIELNHKVTSKMLDGIDLQNFSFSSVHEPCPADVSTEELKKRDWLISSTNEENRCKGVEAIQRSIALATRLHASIVVIHAGHALPDKGLEKKLRALHADGQRESEAYRQIKAEMIQVRADAAKSPFEAVVKSITELLAYAEPLGVRLGIENRYHYMEFPNPNELEILLGLAAPDRIGFLYDVGHAETLDQLGFYAHEEWLKRFSPRIIGTHLHDVCGTTDHYAPGLGTVDFDMVAAYLPEGAIRTCEFQNFNTPEQVRAGLRVLAERGCIKSQPF
ncbi:MAG: Phosphoglycolate phosphatase [Anaerolineales bacterium]|nr:Phosphoglycolate phosphatase [Anaerolineales bacterium]